MTTRVVYADTSKMVAWAEARIHLWTARADAQALGVERDGALVGVVVFDTFGPKACMVHVASDGSRRWLTRGLIRRVCAYLWRQCGFGRVTMIVDARNAAAINLCLRFGAVQEGCLREAAYGGGDQLLFGVLSRDCVRWLDARPRKQYKANAAQDVPSEQSSTSP